MSLVFHQKNISFSDFPSFSQEDPLCRICLEHEPNASSLIHPCKCSGSVKFVHEECLKLWILTSQKDIKSSKCDICKEPYSMEIGFSRRCSCKNIKEEYLNMVMFPLVILIISAIFAIVLTYLIKGTNDKSLQNEEKVYFSLVLVACVAIDVTLIYIFVRVLIKAFCLIKTVNWKINNSTIPGLDDNIQITNLTEINREDFLKPSSNVIITQPAVLKFDGQAAVAPDISQTTLVRANREISAYFSNPHSSRESRQGDQSISSIR